MPPPVGFDGTKRNGGRSGAKDFHDPEAPMWLPTLASSSQPNLRSSMNRVGRMGATKPNGTKRKADLFSAESLTPLDSYGLPNARLRKRKSPSPEPRLPPIKGSSGSLGGPSGSVLIGPDGQSMEDPGRQASGRNKGSRASLNSSMNNSIQSIRRLSVAMVMDQEEMLARMQIQKELGMQGGFMPSGAAAAAAAQAAADAANGIEHIPGSGVTLPSARNVIDDFEYDMIPGIVTSDDVIQFYARYGQDSPVKFFYCVAAESGMDFRPYDLVVVPRSKVGSEYCTISATGVMRMRRGEQSDFMPLGEWIREKYLFSLVRSIPFFRNFSIVKTFRAWKNHVRRNLFMRVRSKLEERLFLAKPTFSPALLTIVGHINEIAAFPMTGAHSVHADDKPKPAETAGGLMEESVVKEKVPSAKERLEQYEKGQTNHREQVVKPRLEEVVLRVQVALEGVCKEAQKQAKLYQESIRDLSELEDTTGVDLYVPAGGKDRSMAAIKQEKIDRARAYMRAMEEAARLGDFVRLVDYLLVEAMVDRVILSVDDMCQFLQAPRQGAKDVKAIFQTQVFFNEQSGAIEFSPNEQHVSDVMQSILEGIISAVSSAPRVLHMRQFGQFFDSKLNGLSPARVIRETPRFVGTQKEILGIIKTDFFDSAHYAEQFEEYRQAWEFGRSFSMRSYQSSNPDMDKIKLDMNRLRDWLARLDRMKAQQAVGVLNVESKTLKELIRPATLRHLDSLKLLLLDRAREECFRSLQQVQARITQLGARPQDLDQFVAFQVMYTEILDLQHGLLEDATKVDDMYELLVSYEQKIPLKDEVKHSDLKEAKALFVAYVDQAKEYILEHTQQQMMSLDKKIHEINEKAMEILSGMHSGKSMGEENNPVEVVAELDERLRQVQALRLRAEQFQTYQRLFSAPADDFTNLKTTEKELQGRHSIWKTLLDLEDKRSLWLTSPVSELNIEAINPEIEAFTSTSYKLVKQYKDDRVVYRLKDSIEQFKQLMPLMEELGNPALKPRHWEAIFEQLGEDYEAERSSEYSVQYLIERGIMSKMEKVQAVSVNASKEFSLEKALEKMAADWVGVEFRVIEYKDTGTFIVGGVDEVQAILDDQVVKIQSMRASPFIKPFEAQAAAWDDLLNTLQDIVDNWVQCQATWQYLEPIFSSPDIMKQMPQEAENFQTVDATWREIMEAAHRDPSCLTIARDKSKLDGLVEANVLLEAIQKGLAAYLEVKRIAFPRFFFLSNDEMLEILSETKDPLRVQPHLKKCFEGINKLEFHKGAEIVGMVSAESELVPFKTRVVPARANGAVEKWLVEVEAAMVEALREECGKGVSSYAKTSRGRWVLEWPGQIVLVVTAVYWTMDMEAALRSTAKGALEGVADKCTAQLGDIVNLVRGQLSGLNRATLSALVVMDVHARDVAAHLATLGIEGNPQDFSWLSQLRMYWETMPGRGEDPTIPVRMMNATVEYGYEYLGNSARLVVTPLTDRCYRTLMGAIHLNLGGAPEGPAGTGKTETTKDLAKALARQCVVFNCSDTLDYLTMAKFFKGLASSGAWACFDEFNRIDLEVLSVVAQQVLEIQLAVKNRVKTFFFEGSELPLRPTCNVFITMNPGYAGRSELPDNLKALFRTVAMMVPDYAMISEIILYSNGYLAARDNARKIVATYKLCSEQLSSQDHYDYGMRAVMAVLRAAGNLKRKFPDEDEFVLVLRSIIDVNLCKFLSHDVPLFNGIVSDLFPGVKLPEPDYKHLEVAIRKQCEVHNLQPTPYFMTKTIQLYEMIVVRHGLMTVGLSFAGKSASLKVLAGALTDLHEQGVQGVLFNKVQCRFINPKSVTMGQLYGETDKSTQEWKDGVLAVSFRQLASDPSEDRKWIVLDGPVDAIWIENMNTVLDDNKKLCLPNSEIIQMSPQMSMIFEVGDLAAASPATVSRCGMVYLEPHQLGWEPLLDSWKKTLPEGLGVRLTQRIDALFRWAVPPALRFVRKEISELSPSTDANLAVTCMRLFDSLIDEFKVSVADADLVADGAAPVCAAASFNDDKRKRWVDSLFLFALVWSIGCTGDNDGRASFDRFIRNMAKGLLPVGYELSHEPPADLNLEVMGNGQEGSTLYDFTFSKDSSSWVPWVQTLATLEIPDGTGFQDIFVPTAESAAYTFLLDTAVHHGQPVLLVGPTGTGKSAYISRYLRSLPKDRFTPVMITLSARTSANMTQDQVDGRLDKRRKGVYGPPMGRKCLVFMDDMNMPMREVYGAQPPIELLRQFMDYQGWFGRDNLFRHLVDVQFLAAMGPPGGGRTFISGRYLRHYNMVGVAQTGESTLRTIFQTILGWHLSSRGFPEQVQALSGKIIDSTLDVYRSAIRSLLPTPTKSHYTFNLRDFGRVVQGVMMMPPSELPEGSASTPVFQRLFVHEIARVFYDRLVDDKDRQWLMGLVKDVVYRHFGVPFDSLFTHLLPPEAAGRPVDVEDMRRLFFCDYMRPDLEQAERSYSEAPDANKVVSMMEDYLADHNGTSKRPMNLAMFLFAVEHVSRICRVLKQPGGHLLLVGVGGSGRQSLTRLGSFICGMEVFQVEITKSYTRNEWREDLKKILRRSGAEFKPVVFLFSDTQIKDEAFVEDLNNILNSGTVPNLFPSDERMQILEAVRPAASKLKLETPLELWGYYLEQCKKYLHIVFCMSPIGGAFRERLRANPSIVNCCTIDWFREWPTDALEAVARKFLKPVDLGEKERDHIVGICQKFHSGVSDLSTHFLSETGRYTYVTPTSYLELLSSFSTLLGVKREENKKLQKRYRVGLEKLQSSAEQVAGMQRELEALQPQLIRTVAEVEALMREIAREKKEVVEPKAEIVKVDEASAQVKADEAKAIKDECEAALAQALPILNDALSALDTIKEADIKYISKLGNPPAAIKLVMEAICVILDVKPAKVKDDQGKTVNDYWKPSLSLLNDKNFINQLKEYDKDNIPPKIIGVIREKYSSNESFTPENAKKASAAAEGMCKWVLAMDKYDVVAKVVAPKRAALQEAEGQYAEVMRGLREKQEELRVLLEKLAKMESDLAVNTEKKNQLEAEVELCSIKLGRAEKLIGGLGGEKVRWTDTAEALGRAYTDLTGDMLISSGIIGYLGPFTAGYRERITAQWKALLEKDKIPHSRHYSMVNVLGQPVKIREWVIAGLPNDSFSINNAIIVANSRRWPLMIDPQGQANKWIKNMERSSNLQVIKLTGGGEYIRTLENAIQFGLPVLLENVGEELDPSLEPLLLKQIFKSGGVNCIRLGDATIEYSDDFRFYITTKLRNPHYLPEIAVKVTLLNFMITPEGLSDQLLGVVVAKERPDLEEQRSALVVQSAENNRKLKEIEDKILEVLSSSEGNILEDETAINIITEAKVLGNDIQEKQRIADITEKEIEKAREAYKPCGAYTSILFFCISDLCNIDPMYQYSLPWFVSLFVSSIAAAVKADSVVERLGHINDHFTYSLYCNVCRSLFEKDKLLFAFLLCSRILESKGQIDPDEWNFLLTGGLGEPPELRNPASEWLVERAWRELMRLGQLPAFKGLDLAIMANPDAWKPVHESNQPHTVPLPGNFGTMDAFKRLLVIRCLRPDKVTPAVQDFVEVNVGRRFVEPPQFNLHACYADSSPTCSLIFVLSPGSDPTAALLQFAAEKGMSERMNAISLGQGQGPKAAALIERGVSEGLWIVLQNCHLAPSWMPMLDKICEELDVEKCHPEFRLWMTSYPSPKFPVNILQNGVKMTNEPPKGIRANMRRSYGLEPICSADFFEGCTNPRAFKKLLFGLVFFHAAIQERRKFGPLGWNIAYGFDDGDLRISVRQLRMFIDENATVPFDALKYVTGECNYGGRVTDDKDRLLLNTILSKCYCPEMIGEEEYKLSSSGLYFAPNEAPIEDFLSYIDGLPIIAEPEAFGLHENADITKDMNDTAMLFSSLLSMGGGGSGGGDAGGVNEDRVAQVVRECMQRLPPPFDIEAVQRKYPVLYEESMNTVLAQEMARFNRLTHVIRDSLRNMDLAIQGLTVMSSELEAAYRSLGINQVPEMWKKISYPTLKPLGSYLTDLYRRLGMLQSWYERGQPPVFWMSGFFFVQSFLTAAQQNYARKHKIPIDMVGYDFEMLDLDPTLYSTPPTSGVYVEGLYLEGCGWDTQKKRLCESNPKVLFVPAPCMWLVPKKVDEFKDYPHYNCPVYRTTERRGVLATTGHSTNFVMFIRLPSAVDAALWTLRGVALISSMSE